jgi:hypothetical protein
MAGFGLDPAWAREQIRCELTNRRPTVDVEIANPLFARMGMEKPRKTGRYRCNAHDAACPAYCEILGGNVDPTTVLYDDPAQLGVDLPESVHRLFADVHAGYAPKPILIQKWAGDGWGGGVREFRHDVMVWVGKNPRAYTVAHEFAHLLSALRNDAPMIDPGVIDRYRRQVVGDFVGAFDHPIVHEILAEYGFDTAAESRERCEQYIAAFDRQIARNPWSDLHLATGYAHMLTVYETADLTPRASERVKQFDPGVHALGQRIATAVRAWGDSNEPMIAALHRLCAGLPNGDYIAANTYARSALVARFWNGAA